MMADILMILAGLVLLFFGGEGLIKGAVSLARSYGLSKLLVSAVIIGFGTSMPEMTVSISASLKGSSEIALGNVVGSNIANILLILGITAILSPISINRQAVRRDTLMMIGSALILCALAIVQVISFAAGLLMFLILLGYIFWSYRQDRQSQALVAAHVQEDFGAEKLLTPAIALAYSVGGLLLLVGGAWLMVEGAVALARDFGISETVIGLTIVAVGTSLPELATAFVAALRKHGDVVIGNILGSNIFNILSILGVSAMVTPIPVTGQIAHIDIWLMLGVTLFFSAYLLRGQTVGRLTGSTMLITYSAYIAWLYLTTGA